MTSYLKRLLRRFFQSAAPLLYNKARGLQNKAATLAFSRSIGLSGTGCQVLHPFYLHNAQHITLGDNFSAGPGLRLEAWDHYAGVGYQPEIVIGSNVVVNFNVHIGAIRSIKIGDDVLIGSNVLITDHSHGDLSQDHLALAPLSRPLVSKGPVIIEKNVWIGEGVCILAGVHVGEGAVIGANAVVTRDVEAGCVVGGVPARKIRNCTPQQ